MKQPKCRTCGKEHALGTCPEFQSTASGKADDIITIASLFSYDPNSGFLSWRVNYGTAKAGERAGTKKPSGYRMVQVNRKGYQEHRIAWVIMNGNLPKGGKQIDHINQVKDDNRWSNLREATAAEQQINSPTQSNNTHGRGVSWRESNKKWRADIYVDGKAVCLGHYLTKVEAQEAYKVGAAKHYRGFSDQAPPTNTNSEPFDRKKYQMLFMRDKRKADKLGLKVSEYRKMKGDE